MCHCNQLQTRVPVPSVACAETWHHSLAWAVRVRGAQLTAEGPGGLGCVGIHVLPGPFAGAQKSFPGDVAGLPQAQGRVWWVEAPSLGVGSGGKGNSSMTATISTAAPQPLQEGAGGYA